MIEYVSKGICILVRRYHPKILFFPENILRKV